MGNNSPGPSSRVISSPVFAGLENIRVTQGRRDVDPCGNGDSGSGRFHMQRANFFFQKISLNYVFFQTPHNEVGQAPITIVDGSSGACKGILRGNRLAMLVPNVHELRENEIVFKSKSTTCLCNFRAQGTLALTEDAFQWKAHHITELLKTWSVVPTSQGCGKWPGSFLAVSRVPVAADRGISLFPSFYWFYGHISHTLFCY